MCAEGDLSTVTMNLLNLKENFKKYKVRAKSLEDFLNRYYKHDRFRGRGHKYTEELIRSHQSDFKEDGYDIISHHDSVTGRIVAYYGPPSKCIEIDARQEKLFKPEPVKQDQERMF